MEREYAVEVIKQILVQANRVFAYSIVTTLSGKTGVNIDTKNNYILQTIITDIANKNGLDIEENNDTITIY